MLVKKKPVVTHRKSRRLASKGKRPIVSLMMTLPHATPLSLPLTHLLDQSQPHHHHIGFHHPYHHLYPLHHPHLPHTLHLVQALLIPLMFLQLHYILSSRSSTISSLSFLISRTKFVSYLHRLLISLPRWRPVLVQSSTQQKCRPSLQMKKRLHPDPSSY